MVFIFKIVFLFAMTVQGAGFYFDAPFQDEESFSMNWGAEPEPAPRPMEIEVPRRYEAPTPFIEAVQHSSPKQVFLRELRLEPEEKYNFLRKSFQRYLNRPAKAWRMTPVEIMEKMQEISQWIAPLEEEIKISWLAPGICREKAVVGLKKIHEFLLHKLNIPSNTEKTRAVENIIMHVEWLIKEYKNNTDTSQDYVYGVQKQLKNIRLRIGALFSDFKAEQYFPAALLFDGIETAIRVNEATGVVSQFFAQNNLEVPKTPEYVLLRVAVEQFYEKIIANLLGGIKFLSSLNDKRSLDMARQNKLIIAEIAMARNDHELAMAMCEDICLQQKSTPLQKITAAFYFAKMGVPFMNPFTAEKYDYAWILNQEHTPQWIREKSMIALGVIGQGKRHLSYKGPLTHELDIKAFNEIQGIIDQKMVRQKNAQNKRSTYLSSLEIRPAFALSSPFLTLESGSQVGALGGISPKEQALSFRVSSELPLSRSDRPLGFNERALSVEGVMTLAQTRMLTREEAESALMLESTVDRRQERKNREWENDHLRYYGTTTKYADLPVDEGRMDTEEYEIFRDPCVGPKMARENVPAEEDYVNPIERQSQADMAGFNRAMAKLYGVVDYEQQDALQRESGTQIQRHPLEATALYLDQELALTLFSFSPDENFAEPRKSIAGLSGFLKNLDQKYAALKNGEDTIKFFLLAPNQEINADEIADFEEQLKKTITDIYYLPKVPKDAFFALAQRYPEEFKEVSFASFFKYAAEIQKKLFDTLEAKYENLRQTLPDERAKISHKIAQLIKENMSIENRFFWLHEHYQEVLQQLGPFEKCRPYNKALWLKVHFEVIKLSMIASPIDWKNVKMGKGLELCNDREIRKQLLEIIDNPFAGHKLQLKAQFALYEFDRKRSLHPTTINLAENSVLAMRPQFYDYEEEQLRSKLLYSNVAFIDTYEQMLTDDCPPSLVPEIMLALAELYIEEALRGNDTVVLYDRAFKIYQTILTNARPRLSDKLKARVGLALLERLQPAFRDRKNVEKSASPRLIRTDKVLDQNVVSIEQYLHRFSDQVNNIVSGSGIDPYLEVPFASSTEVGNMRSDWQMLEDILGDADFCSYRINEVKLWLAKISYFGLPGLEKNPYRSFYLLKQIISDRSVSANIKAQAELYLAKLYLFSKHKDFVLAEMYLNSVSINENASIADRKLAQKYIERMIEVNGLKRKAENQDDRVDNKRLKLDRTDL